MGCCRTGGDKLPYFHDSNVLIGYYFHTADTWGQAATSVFDDPEMNYTSTSVWDECFGIENDGRCNTIENKILGEFRRAITALKRDPSSESLAAKAEEWRIRGIVVQAVSCTDGDATATLKLLEKLKGCYEQECMQRLIHLEDKKVLVCHQRRAGYNEIYHFLSVSIDDKDDIEVVLDAHDLALEVPDLVFWTGDHNHIVRNREQVLVQTDLLDVRFLGDAQTQQ